MGNINNQAAVIGQTIKELRKNQLLTQKSLAEGICSQTTISLIESGLTLPSVDILYYLSKRLNVSLDYFFQESEREIANYEITTTELIEQLWKTKDYEEIYRITESERKQQKNRDLSHEFYLFIELHYYLTSNLSGKMAWDTCIRKLKKLIRDNTIHKPKLLDLRIKNAIANILVEHGKNKEAMKIYEDLLRLNYMEDSYSSVRLRLKVYFNLARLYYQSLDYEKSYSTALNGIKLSIKFEDVSMIGNLYVHGAQCLQQLNRHKEALEFLNQAKFIYTLLKRSWYLEFVENLLQEAKGR
ncbi:helix-turn-helix domain-containing protein [Bacillus sp. THAF10]|uniref:helix-turn-helix domain-containing protein n=1 Tax=Bacillus sp. THAF10 TaxID=2587848 RepID=UPI0015625E49|nr:helix-turn-helix domain-containing protein [Bacillus sp. THAF10]